MFWRDFVPEYQIKVMAIKKSTLGAQFFQRLLNCRIVCGTPFLKNIWVPIFFKICQAPALCTIPFSLLDPQHFVISSRVPGGVRHPSFVFIRQRVRAPGRSPCIIIRQRVREPGRSPTDHPTFTSGHQLVPPPANIKQIAGAAGKYNSLKMGTKHGFFFWPCPSVCQVLLSLDHKLRRCRERAEFCTPPSFYGTQPK